MTIAAKARLLRQAGGIIGRSAFPVGGMPTSPKDLTPEWLTSTLCASTPGARVTHVELGPVNNGTTSRRTFTVQYDDAGEEAGLPTQLFAKFTDRLLSRLLLGPVGAVRNEGEFYSHVQPRISVTAPEPYFVAFEDTSWRSMFILEDVGRTRRSTFSSPKVRVDRSDAESMVVNLATLHAAFWDKPKPPWLQSFKTMQILFNEAARFEKRTLVGFDRAAGLLPAKLLDRRRELYPAAMRSMDLNARGPQTFLHNDTHIGNWFRTGAGEMGLYDWQATVHGCWASDVSYALTSALEPDDCRAWEQDLLKRYLAELGERISAAPPSFDDAWLAYRQQVFHAFIYWLFTLGEGPLQPPMQPRDLTEINCARIGRAVDDLRAFEAVAKA